MIRREQSRESNMSLSRFANQVLSRGAEAVLPQNLPGQWLERIQKMADDFLDANFEGKNCADVSDAADPVFTACVTEIIKETGEEDIEISRDRLIKYITIYAISVTMETVRRETGLDIEPPTLKNIFSDKRLKNLKNQTPELGKFFKQVCLDNSEGKTGK